MCPLKGHGSHGPTHEASKAGRLHIWPLLIRSRHKERVLFGHLGAACTNHYGPRTYRQILPGSGSPADARRAVARCEPKTFPARNPRLIAIEMDGP